MAAASGLTKRTPHTSLPENTAGSWVDFGNRESGQLDKANDRADGILGIGMTCDKWQAEAKKKVERKPFLKRVFG